MRKNNTAVGECIARSASEPTDGHERNRAEGTSTQAESEANRQAGTGECEGRQSYIDLAKQFIDEHNENKDWSIFDRLETMAIVMFAKWLDSKKAINEADDDADDERIRRRADST